MVLVRSFGFDQAKRKKFIFMLQFIELVIAFSIIILVVPQTPTENIVLRTLLETGFFGGYRQAKDFLIQTTWILMFLFFVILIVLNTQPF